MIELISSHIGFVLSVLYAILWYYVVKLTSKGFLNVKNYLSLFLILLPAMVAIISVIKGSLALSLGLVGALSIIRFRTPIKEPIELMYFFVPIALGLALGAEKYFLSVIFFVIVSVSLLATSKFRAGINSTQSYSIEIITSPDTKVEDINSIVASVFPAYDLQRCNVSKEKIVLSYKIANFDISLQEQLISQINKNFKDTSISIFNNSHIVS